MGENDNKMVALKSSTKEGLDSLKPTPNATYDEIVRGLLAFWRSKNNDKPVVLEEAA